MARVNGLIEGLLGEGPGIFFNLLEGDLHLLFAAFQLRFREAGLPEHRGECGQGLLAPFGFHQSPQGHYGTIQHDFRAVGGTDILELLRDGIRIQISCAGIQQGMGDLRQARKRTIAAVAGIQHNLDVQHGDLGGGDEKHWDPAVAQPMFNARTRLCLRADGEGQETGSKNSGHRQGEGASAALRGCTVTEVRAESVR